MTQSQFMLAAAGDTWGISGPTFLSWYWILAAATFIAVLLIRRAVREQLPPGGAGRQLDNEPYLAAYLNGGADLALTAVLALLRTDGLVRCHEKRCELVGSPAVQGRPPLERTVLNELMFGPRSRGSLGRRPSVVTASDELCDELVRRGLLMSDEQLTRYRRWGSVTLVLPVLGTVRLFAGFAAARPIGYLLLSVLLVVVIAWSIRAVKPRRTVLGQQELSRLRAEHEHLDPKQRPDWTANGATAAALAVGVFGIGALWAADPAFAGELVKQRASDVLSGSDSGGGLGWFSGGGSGGGSSCGGGCGGGGCGG